MSTIKYLIHKTRYGWQIKLEGWLGPSMGTYPSKEEAYKIATHGAQGIDWVIEAASPEQVKVVG